MTEPMATYPQRTKRLLMRIEEILHPQQGIPAGSHAKALITEAYDIYISGLELEHAQSRTEATKQFFDTQLENEEEQYAKAKYEQEHDL